jgi:RHS repeat-associated protein
MRKLPMIVALLLCPPALLAQDVQYYHLDAIGNVRAVTNQSGTIVERHDYLPFGEECTTGACGSNPGIALGQPKHFTGKERDTETGLDYFGARYYRGSLARFTTVDPAMSATLGLHDPQKWNRYAYARNNPFRYIDPDGRLTVIINGTWAKDAPWAQPGTPFNEAVSNTFHEEAVVFSWSGGNTKAARAKAAEELGQFIASRRKEGEPLNVVSHSHGGNVMKLYTLRPEAQEIDTAVDLGTPQRPDYRINRSKVRNYINVYSKRDDVQQAGGEWFALGQAFRIDPEATNLDASEEAGRHSELHSSAVWEKVEQSIPH